MYWSGLIIGALLLVLVLDDAFEVMLLPRRIRRKLRFVALFFRYTWTSWSWLAERMGLGFRRDTFLSLYGPLSLVLLLGSWVMGLIVGFAAVQWALGLGAAKPVGFTGNLLLSADTFFTLGTASAASLSKGRRAVAVFEAGTGLAFLAIVISYLPVLYQLFSRRETHVITLDARAGSPPTATVLLARHGGDDLHALDELLHEWERWSAEVVESHLSYPMLSYYRSQHDNQSWLAALTAIMDACALVMVGIKGLPTFQARMTFSISRLAVIELSRVLAVKPEVAAETRLPSGEYARMKADLTESEMIIVDDDNAEDRLAEFRATYEPFLIGLAEYLLMALPGWLPDGEPLDNWQNSPRGRSARRLIEAVVSQPS
jgi:hypothetical protein